MDEDVSFDILVEIQHETLRLEAEKADTASLLDKRAIAIAITHLETAMLWIANSRPD